MKLSHDIEQRWGEALPHLISYISIPALSPAFDPDWRITGQLDRAADDLAGWAAKHLEDFPGASVEVLRLENLTPSLFISVLGRGEQPVLFYGHLDKQPPMDGWENGRSAWEPVIEGERLYGRGGADDGYALFSAIIALKALKDSGLAHPPVRIPIEGSEESGSHDLLPTLESLLPSLGTPCMIVALDAGCGNYDQLWVTTSLRGQVAGTLSIRTLRGAIHSGDAGGIVPTPFMIARSLLSRLEDAGTGAILPDFLHAAIPAGRIDDAAKAGAVLGSSIFEGLGTTRDLRPLRPESDEQLLSRSWRPQLTITGLDGLPPVSAAAAVAHPELRLKVSLRLPPTVDASSVAPRIKALMEDEPPFGADVSFEVEMVSQGWAAPEVPDDLEQSLNDASVQGFGRPTAKFGGGGGIPFLAALEELFPGTPFVVTGVLGPASNAHGPNEFLHLGMARNLTVALAHLLTQTGDRT